MASVMRARVIGGAGLAALLGLALCTAVLAQSGAGGIQGTVSDSTGGVIPGASIHVVNTATGVATDSRSNGTGFYQVPGLFTGHYRIEITAPGMKTYITGIQLLVAQDAVINATLTPGAVTQQVVVSGNAVQLTTTDNGTVTETLENARINQIPMNGRDLTDLMQDVTPGLTSGEESNAGGGPNIYGLRAMALDVKIDGATTQNLFKGGEFDLGREMLDPDSVQEVRMVADGSGAQYATPATAVVATKSGTNRLHGTFFETARNNALGIAKSRQDPSNFAAPHYVRNEFGLSAGGPIVLPHVYHGKDKSFWFFAYERYSLADSSAALSNVPTVAMSQGDFSGLINSSGVLQTLYDPATTQNSAKCAATGKANAYCRTPFPNNQIPLSEESPMAKLYFQLAPLPTNSADPLVANSYNLTALSPEFVVEPQITARLDHVFNENNHAYLRYTQNISTTDITGGPRNRAADGIPVGGAVGDNGYLNSPISTYLVAVGYTHIFSPTFFAETVASQQWLGEKKVPGVEPNVDWESKIGLPNNFGEPGFPSITKLIFPLGSDQANTAAESQIVTMLDENLTKVEGKHQLLFGAHLLHLRMANASTHTADTDVQNVDPTAVYQPTSGAKYTALANTGFADASMFLGSSNSYTANLNSPYYHLHRWDFDAYIQDNYHPSRSLTVNIGVRYEDRPAQWEKYGVQNGFDLKNDAEVLTLPASTLISEGLTTQAIISNMENNGVKFETPEQAGMPANTLLRNYPFIFLPRVGIAYQLFGGRHGTVIRGGYGRYSEPQTLQSNSTRSSTNLPFKNTYTTSYATAAQAIDDLPNELLRYDDPAVFPIMGLNSANVVNTNSTTAILPGSNPDDSISPDMPPAFDTETNFTIEQALKGTTALRVSWIYTHTTNLPLRDYYNEQPSDYQWEMGTGTLPPTGNVVGSNQYSATAMGPYEQTTWGQNDVNEFCGWSNYNALEVSFQRLFHRGSAFQISYDFAKAMRAGGAVAGSDNGTVIYPYANYPGALGSAGTMTPAYGPVYAGVPPPALPANLPFWADYRAMDKFQQYELDTDEPVQHILFTGIVDLPFGRGRRFLSNVNGLVNELIGGFQLAGDGSVTSQTFNLAAANYGPVSPIHVYKHRYPITDCRSGVCEKSFLWFNGYLAPTVTTGVAGSVCTSNCVSGLPADYVAEQTPIDNNPTSTYYGDNEVEVTLANGSQVADTYDVGPNSSNGPGGGNYLVKSAFNGPINYTEDISIYKVFPIREGMTLRFNVDAFNALNVQGWDNPGTTDGVETNLSSYNNPRQIQLSARLTF